MKMIRSVLSVLAGYAIVAISFVATLSLLSALAPAAFPPESAEPAAWALALLLVCGVIYMTTGGFAAARIGRRRPVAHAVALGLLLLALGLVTVFSTAGGPVPLWYRVAGAVIGLPAAMLGGILAARRVGVPPGGVTA